MRVAEHWAQFRSSFRFRLFLISSLIMLLMLMSVVALILPAEVREHLDEQRKAALLLASRVAGECRLPLFAENLSELRAIARQALEFSHVRQVRILSSRGTVLVDEQRGAPHSAGDLTSVTVPVMPARLTSASDDALEWAAGGQEASLGSVTLAMDTRELQRGIRALALKICLVSLVLWLVWSVSSYLVLRRMTRSFEELMRGIRELGEGHLAARIEVVGNDEPARAASAVNRMAEALERRDQENRWLQEELVNAMQLEVQQEKRHIMAKLIQTNRMTSIGLLASSVAHEINTPNGAIRLANMYLLDAWRDVMSFLDGMEREGHRVAIGGQEYAAARERLEKTLDVIGRCSGRIEEVVGNLRSYYLGDLKDRKEPLFLNKVVEDALVIVQAHRGRGSCELLSDLAPGMPMVSGKSGQLEQVVTNLVVNALHAIPEHRAGRVVVATGHDAAAGMVWLRVSDNGEGIPPEAVPHLLEPFYSTRTEQGGSGLGLYICNYIVGEHGGQLAIDSTPGDGTRVTVSLPVSPPA